MNRRVASCWLRSVFGIAVWVASCLSVAALTIKDSADFTVGFAGNAIWNSGYQNGWSEVGTVTESIDGTVVRAVNGGGGMFAGTSSTADGGTTTWNTANDGDWTLELRARFNAVPNGYALWLGVDTDLIVVEIFDTYTKDYDVDHVLTFNTPHDPNVDGQFHVYRVAHDSVNNVYHVWRDGVRLTPAAGAPYDSTSNENRMLLGDYTSGTFGNGYDLQFDYIRYDETGAYAPPMAQRSSARFPYRYEMDTAPNNQDLDDNATDDFYDTGAIPVSGGLADGSGAEEYFRCDFGGSIWRSQCDVENLTVEFSVHVQTTANGGAPGGEGSAGTLGLYMRNPLGAGGHGFYLVVSRAGTSLETAGGSVSLGAHDNTDGFHVYRVARRYGRGYVYRDGVLLNPGGTAADKDVSNNNTLLLGDIWTTGLEGDYEIDYLRLNNTGAYAPTGDTALHWGFDYTSGAVSSRNWGVIEDDGGAGNSGIAFSGTPTYAADIPAASRLKDCVGVGSLDLSAGWDIVSSAPINVVTKQDLVAAGGLTMEVWAKQTSTAPADPNATYGSGTIMTMMDAFSIASTQNTYRVVVNSFGNPGPQCTVGEAIKLANGWTHLAAVIRDYTEGATTNGTVELWVNGYLMDSVSINYAPSLNLDRRIGLGSSLYNVNGKFRWDGFVYEPRITLAPLDGSGFLWAPPPAGTIFEIR